MFYPKFIPSDNAGKNIAVPSAHGILRTIALSDPHLFRFAPAGTRRGGITNASASRFIDSEGEFNPIALEHRTK